MSSYEKEIIDPGDRASKLAHQICVNSYGNCPAVRVVSPKGENFRHSPDFLWRKSILEKMSEWEDPQDAALSQHIENDGAGGKTQFFSLLGEQSAFRHLGREIIAMNADDFARAGRFPAVLCNDLQIKRITENNISLFEALMEGFGEALAESGLVNITGEVAVMKHSITSFCDTGDDSELHLTWSGSCIGLSSQKLIMDNSGIKPDMLVIGFWEPGYRCNGGTFFTELLVDLFGPEPKRIAQNETAREFVRKLTIPSVIYSPTLTRLVGWNSDGTPGAPLANIKGAAHITGGGIWSKLKEILPSGVGVHLDSMLPPPKVLLEAQEMSFKLSDTKKHLTDRDAYRIFHGGCGMIVVVKDLNDAEKVLREAERDGIWGGIVGEVRKEEDLPAKITIESRFLQGGILTSE